MKLSEQFEAETGLEVRIIAGVRVESNEYEARYLKWLEAKVLKQAPAPEVSEWVSCQTAMPKYNDRVLLCGSGGGVFIGELKEKVIHNEDGWVIEGDTDEITYLSYITNWKTLPEGTLF